jgi:hypothetical protein
LKKWFIGFGTGLPVIPTGITDRFTNFGGFQPLPADRFTGFGTSLPVIPTGLPILDFLNVKFEFRAVFDQFYRFSW